MDGISRTMRGWAMQQIGHWPRLRFDRAEMGARLAAWAQRDPRIIMFDIAQGRVTAGIDPDTSPHGPDPKARGKVYEAFLQDVVNTYCPGLEVALGIFLGDTGVPEADVPVFAFQKPAASSALLLPDIDLVAGGFQTLLGFRDPCAYEEKSISAVFVGSTSGGWIDEQVARDMSLPRLRAAAFFRGNPDVDFRLPVIVQANSAATDILRQHGIGDGERVSWPAQCQHRFVISMDGNGATCSRVLLSLLSNSVLLKYVSPYELHYFDGMRPWQHYVPVRHDKDVLDLVAMERRRPGLFAGIAQAGREFAVAYLAKDPSMRFTAELLRQYGELYAQPAASATDVSIVAHVSNVGDVRSENGRAGTQSGQIEGFRIVQAGALGPSDLAATVRTAEGQVIGPQSAALYCGTRGRRVAATGFQLELSAPARFACVLAYRGWFADGEIVGPVPEGTLCSSTRNASLRAIEVTIALRQA